MKLLLDENLSRRLVPVLEPLYPGTIHVSTVGLERADDAEIWGYARDHGFVLVTKDADFVDRSLAEGPPPKVIWIRRGNCSTREAEDLLRDQQEQIERLEADPSRPFVVLVQRCLGPLWCDPTAADPRVNDSASAPRRPTAGRSRPIRRTIADRPSHRSAWRSIHPSRTTYYGWRCSVLLRNPDSEPHSFRG